MGLIAGMLVAPSVALAHGSLAASTPVQGSTVTEPLREVSLSFTEKPSPSAQFSITAPTGVRVDGGWSHGEPARLAEPVKEYQLKDGTWQPLLYETGFPVKVAVAYLPAPGEYVVAYNHTASDGDVVKGELRFTYHGDVTPAPPGWLAPSGPAALQAPAPAPVVEAQAPPAAAGSSVWGWLVPVLLVVALGLCAVLVIPLVRRRSGSGKPGGRPGG